MLTINDHCQRLRVRHAIKMTAAAIICALVGFNFHMSMGYLSPIFIVVVLGVFRHRTVEVGVPGLLGVLIAGGIALVISAVLVDAPFALVLCMLSLLFVWMALMPRVPLGQLLGGILIAMVLFSVALGTVRPEDLVWSFWTQLLLALVVATAVDCLVWPSGADESLGKTLATLFEEFASDMEKLGAEQCVQGHETDASDADLLRLDQLSNVLSNDFRGNSRSDFRLKFRCWLIWDRFEGLKRLVRTNEFFSRGSPNMEVIKQITSGFAHHFRELSDAALRRRPARHLATDMQHRVEDFIASLQESQFRERLGTERALALATLIQFMKLSLEDHTRLTDAFNTLLDGRSKTAPQKELSGFSPVGGFSWPDAGAFKTSAKITLIVLLLLLGVLYLNSPGSGLVAFYGVVFGMTVNLGLLDMKRRAGVIGVITGLAYGMLGILVVFYSPHLLLLLGVFALGFFIATYVSTGEGARAFMGTQAALLIPYVFLIYEGPEWTISDAVTRALALVVSALVATFVQRLIWPVNPLVHFRAAIAMAVEDMGRAWSGLWETASSSDDVTTAVKQLSPEALIRDFCQCAEWLRDSQYLIGSDHLMATRYSRILRSLEEIYAELQLLARLLQKTKYDPGMKDMKNRIGEPVAAIARGLETIARYYRDGATADDLHDLLTLLEPFRDVRAWYDDLTGRGSDVLETDQWEVFLLQETISDIARSLSAVAEGILAGVFPELDRRTADGGVCPIDATHPANTRS